MEKIFGALIKIGVIFAMQRIFFLALIVFCVSCVPAHAEFHRKSHPVQRRVRSVPARAEVQAETKAVSNWSQSMYQFSLNWLKGLSEQKEPTRVLSPLMFYNSMLMLVEGSQAETREQLLNALPAEKKDQMNLDDWQVFLRTVRQAFQKDSKMATKLWLCSRYSFREDFQKKIQAFDGMEVESVDFTKSKTKTIIQKWLAQQVGDTSFTWNHKLQRDQVLLLTGILDFHAAWIKPFTNTRKGTFHRTDGSTENLSMMSQVMTCQLYEDELLQAVFLPLTGSQKNQNFEYVILLPQKTRTLSEMKKKLDIPYWEKIDKERREHSTDITMPKFTLKSQDSLTEMLNSLGVQDAFDVKRADFSNISNDLVVLTDVRNNLVFNVSEKGIDATVVTEVFGAGGFIHPVKVNRPFLFILRETSSDTPIFVGQFNGLKKKSKGNKPSR